MLCIEKQKPSCMIGSKKQKQIFFMDWKPIRWLMVAIETHFLEGQELLLIHWFYVLKIEGVQWMVEISGHCLLKLFTSLGGCCRDVWLNHRTNQGLDSSKTLTKSLSKIIKCNYNFINNEGGSCNLIFLLNSVGVL